eukprot:25255_1
MASDQMKKSIRELSFTKYEFMIAKPDDFESVLHFLVSQYKKNNLFNKLFNHSNEQVQLIVQKKLKALVNVGRCFILVNKVSKKIVASASVKDYYDSGEWGSQNVSLPSNINVQHALELLSVKSFDHKKLKDLSESKYGVLCEFTLVASDSNSRAKFLAVFMTIHLANMFLNNCGYKKWYGISTDPQAFKLWGRTGADVLYGFDFSHYIFSDGTEMLYYLNCLQQKRRLCQPKLMQFRKQCKFHIVSGDRAWIQNAMKMLKSIANKHSKL